MSKNTKIQVKGQDITTLKKAENDFISLTDIARYRDKDRSDYILQNWLRNKSTIEYIGLWEQLNNPNFNSIEFDGFKKEAGSNSFVLTPKKWITATNAIGLISRPGRYGSGTFAHKDIAFEFASWISAEFKLFLIKEFQRLKDEESTRLALGWDLKRNLVKINYKIHTDAIKENLTPPHLTTKQTQIIYASEADVLNIALFGMTAKEWRDRNTDKEGNIRDYANVTQLVVLANLEGINAELIRKGLPQKDRLKELNNVARRQINSLLGNSTLIKLK